MEIMHISALYVLQPRHQDEFPAVERDEASHLHAVLHEAPMNSDIIVIHFWIVTHIPAKNLRPNTKNYNNIN